jgi:hypothetical protein
LLLEEALEDRAGKQGLAGTGGGVEGGDPVLVQLAEDDRKGLLLPLAQGHAFG